MLRQSSETLAGRIAYRQLNGFSLAEVGGNERLRLWVRGGFPAVLIWNASEFARSFGVSDNNHLKLQRIDGIHAGDRTFPLDAKIRTVALSPP
jgi:hypothetical protein